MGKGVIKKKSPTALAGDLHFVFFAFYYGVNLPRHVLSQLDACIVRATEVIKEVAMVMVAAQEPTVMCEEEICTKLSFIKLLSGFYAIFEIFLKFHLAKNVPSNGGKVKWGNFKAPFSGEEGFCSVASMT